MEKNPKNLTVFLHNFTLRQGGFRALREMKYNCKEGSSLVTNFERNRTMSRNHYLV